MTNPAATGGNETARASGGDLPLRLASAAVLALVSLGCAWFGGWAAGIAVAAVMAVVHAEWIGVTSDKPMPAAISTAVLVAGLMVLAAGYTGAALGLAALAIVIAAALSRGIWRPAGVAYAAVLGFGLLLLRFTPEHGLTAILFLFAVVWGTDSGAFFAGRAIGGPRLWPAVSPKKTWAGSIGGLVAGVLLGTLVAALAGIGVRPGLLVVAALLSLVSQAGDLAESSVKRHFGVKDSGRIVPGHGGLMDRVDGLVFAAGLAVLIGWIHGGGGDLAGGLLAW